MTTATNPLSPQMSRETRPRASSGLSFSSNRSHRSSGSGHKLELTESAKDKEKRRLNTKADPSKALNEAQPAAVALEESNLANLRQTTHRDFDGNVITDPDRSNPTRHRMERPLDTIRSFNAAAEGTSNRRSSSYHSSRPSSALFDNPPNRRSSYYGPGSPPQRRPGPFSGGYYRNSSYGMGPQSSVEESPGSSQQFGRPPRNPNGPAYPGYGENSGFGNSQGNSYETATSGSDENNKSTNPSSQNSSFDRLHQMRKPDEHFHDQNYGYDNQYAPRQQNQPFPPYNDQNGNYRPNKSNGPPPPPPPKQIPPPNNPRQMIKLDGSGSTAPSTTTTTKRPQPAAKRQSWIKRTFSRSDS